MKFVEQRSITAFDFEGLAIRDLTANLDGSGSVAEIGVAPGIRHPPARSTRSDKYYIGLEGEVAFHLADREVTLQAGDLLLIERGEWFAYENPTESVAKLLLLHIPSFDLASEEFREELP